MTSTSIVQVIDLTDSPPLVNNRTRKIRRTPDYDVEATSARASRKRKNGETRRTRAGSRDRSVEAENARSEEGAETRQAEGVKGGSGGSTKKRNRRSVKSKDKSKDSMYSSHEDTQQDTIPTFEDSQLFFADTMPAPVPAGMVFDAGGPDTAQSSSSLAPEADKTPPLLLPAHVSVLDSLDKLPVQIVQPVDSDSDTESYIEYLDYDDRLVS